MATLSMFEKSTVFHYGFLSSRVSRVLEKFEKRKCEKLDPDTRRIVSAAENFIQDVLNGQRLIAGEKKGFSPSIEGLEAFGYAINTIQLLKETPSSQKEIDAIFQRVKRVLDNILEEKTPQQNDLSFTERFFSLIADSLLEDARALVRPKPSLTNR